MSFETTGRLAEVFETQQISDRFQKREFILEIKESNNAGFEFVEYVKFQATQDKCSLLDKVQVNDMVKVGFNLRGRKWEKDGKTSYFTNLDAWRVDKLESDSTSPSIPKSSDNGNSPDDAPFPDQAPDFESGDFDDLPF